MVSKSADGVNGDPKTLPFFKEEHPQQLRLLINALQPIGSKSLKTLQAQLASADDATVKERFAEFCLRFRKANISVSPELTEALIKQFPNHVMPFALIGVRIDHCNNWTRAERREALCIKMQLRKEGYQRIHVADFYKPSAATIESTVQQVKELMQQLVRVSTSSNHDDADEEGLLYDFIEKKSPNLVETDMTFARELAYCQLKETQREGRKFQVALLGGFALGLLTAATAGATVGLVIAAGVAGAGTAGVGTLMQKPIGFLTSLPTAEELGEMPFTPFSNSNDLEYAFLAKSTGFVGRMKGNVSDTVGIVRVKDGSPKFKPCLFDLSDAEPLNLNDFLLLLASMTREWMQSQPQRCLNLVDSLETAQLEKPDGTLSKPLLSPPMKGCCIDFCTYCRYLLKEPVFAQKLW